MTSSEGSVPGGGNTPEAQDGLEDMQGERMRMRFTSRDRARVARFFERTELVEPGIVRVGEWRQDPAASGAGRSSLWCGAGRKR
jgi:S-adenosyl methyltransferase